MNPIASYAFGRMAVNDQIFTSDLIIFPDGRIQNNWIRHSGHVLVLADLDALIQEKPDLIIAGTGAHGRMTLAPGLKTALTNMGIEVQAMPTDRAVARFNHTLEHQTRARQISACFHLTC